MAAKTRYMVNYRSNDPSKTGVISFGVYAKKKSQALKRVREYIYTNELHDSKVYDYRLDAIPSNKPDVLHEIPDEDDSEGYETIEEHYHSYDTD